MELEGMAPVTTVTATATRAPALTLAESLLCMKYFREEPFHKAVFFCTAGFRPIRHSAGEVFFYPNVFLVFSGAFVYESWFIPAFFFGGGLCQQPFGKASFCNSHRRESMLNERNC